MEPLQRIRYGPAFSKAMRRLEKGNFNPSSAWIQLEQNNVDTAREKSGQLLKEFKNEHLVNDCEDVITNLCQKQGPSALQSPPMFLQTGPG